MVFYVVKKNGLVRGSGNRTLARASDGRLWCAFLWASEVQVAYSDDEGATWTLEQVTTTPAITVWYPTIAIDSGDNLHVVWRQQTVGVDLHVYYRKRNADGTWDARETVTDTESHLHTMPTIAIDSSDNVHVVWESSTEPILPITRVIKHREKTVLGWQAIESVSDALPILTFQSRVCLAIGFDDVIHVAWPSQGCGLNPGSYNIQYKQKTALGWQAQEGVTDIAFSQDMPVIALDSSNNVHMAFYGRGWGVNPGIYNMRYAVRTAGVWGTYEAITDVAIGQNVFGSLRYHSIALDMADDVHVVWSADGWGTNPADSNVQHRCKSGGVWQAQDGLTDRPDDQGSVSLIWAMFPLIGTERTNIPVTGYAFLLNGDILGDDQVEYWTEATWLSAVPFLINKAYALAREEL